MQLKQILLVDYSRIFVWAGVV